MKRCKGFTLIELLAIIVILAIIAVITVPIILNVIENAKIGTVKDSAYGYKDAINKYYVSGMLNDDLIDLSGRFEVNDGKLGDFDIDFTGTRPSSGYMVYDNTNLVEGCIVIEDYKVVFVDGEVTTVDKGDCNEDIETKDPETPDVPDVPVEPDTPTEPNEPLFAYKCKRATELHSDECTVENGQLYCYAAGYSVDGSKGTKTITYGNLGSGNVINSGDAFDCDINGDGEYNSNNERFYYVSDLYEASSNSFNTNYAVLIYYSNVSNNVAVNDTTHTYKYYTSNQNWHGPVEAINYLPTINEWTNISLSNNVRTILAHNGSTSTTGGDLPTAFNYSKDVDGVSVPLAARFITSQELANGCGFDVNSYNSLDLSSCAFLMENTLFHFGVEYVTGYWIENPPANNKNGGYYVSGSNVSISAARYISNSHGVRPAIEVLKTEIEL